MSDLTKRMVRYKAKKLEGDVDHILHFLVTAHKGDLKLQDVICAMLLDDVCTIADIQTTVEAQAALHSISKQTKDEVAK